MCVVGSIVSKNRKIHGNVSHGEGENYSEKFMRGVLNVYVEWRFRRV